MDISFGGVQNYMIKRSDNGGLDSVDDYVTQKLLISDATLSFFIPPRVRKTTHRLCQIHGCDICIIPKDMNIYLNIFITKLVTYLQHRFVEKNTRNSAYSTKSAAHYKETLFPYGEFLHATIKDTAQ